MSTAPTLPRSRQGGFDIGPTTRVLVVLACTVLSVATTWAITRGITGLAPAHPSIRSAAVIAHLATVLPAVPLGAWLLLSRKGTERHRMLGKLWIALMVATATAALFIRSSGSLSWIHIFVPLTYLGCWQIYRSAREGKVAQHRKHIVQMYLGALTIPGAVAFLGSRLMGTWLYG